MKKQFWMWAAAGLVAACGSSNRETNVGDTTTLADGASGDDGTVIPGADTTTPGPGEEVTASEDSVEMTPDSGESDTKTPIDTFEPVDATTAEDVPPLVDVSLPDDVTQVEDVPDITSGSDAVTDPDAGPTDDVGADDVGADDVGAGDVGAGDAGAVDTGTPPDDATPGVTLVDEKTPCTNNADCQAGNACSGWQCSPMTQLCENYWGPPDCCTDASDCDDSNACTKDTCFTMQGTCIHTDNCP